MQPFACFQIFNAVNNCEQPKNSYQEVIGLIPAGGQATRIAPLPCSKELYPIGFRQEDEDGNLRPKVVSHYLLEKMQFAGVTKAYVILGNGKWDIPAYLGDGALFNMHLAYLVINLSPGVPYTLDKAYPFVQDKTVALGFPDIMFQSEDSYVRLIERQIATNANIVLGLFLTDVPHKCDMVDFDEEGRICRIIIKPKKTHLRYTWVNAIWTPAFTQFMHRYLSTLDDVRNQHSTENKISERQELFVGDVIQAAIQDGLRAETVVFPNAKCVDIGTSDGLVMAFRNMNMF